MPYRNPALILALAGALSVFVLILLGMNFRRAARTGPSWKRRLLGSGLVLLAALGVTSCEREPEVTCYAAGPPRSRSETSLQNLKARMPHLEKYSQADRLDPQVIERLLQAVERDIATLTANLDEVGPPGSEARAAAETILKYARGHVEKIRARMPEKK
jgi:hypothetical protein